MRNIIIAFTLIVAVACDVSEIVQGDGWSKDASGYHYDVPAEKFFEDAPAEQEVIQEFVPEQAAPGCPNGGSGPYCCYNGSDQEDCNLPQDDVIEIIEYIDVPVDNLRDYLPPKNDEFKRKRQVPVRRQARRVVRRVVRRRR